MRNYYRGDPRWITVKYDMWMLRNEYDKGYADGWKDSEERDNGLRRLPRP